MWSMKTTKYFEYTRKRPDRSGIEDEWITKTIESPIRSIKQSVHNAFFDRSFKRGAKHEG